MRIFGLLLSSILLLSCGSGGEKGGTASPDRVEATAPVKTLEALRAPVAAAIAGKNARVGIGILDLQTGDTLLVNGDGHFPLMSVAKFPQAITLLHLADSGRFDVGAPVQFGPEDLKVNTGSSIRKDHPESSFTLPFTEVLRYAIGQSDNITANKMFELEGGPAAVENYVRSLGITDMGFGTDYFFAAKDAHQLNWSTPRAMLQLMDRFHKGNILSPAKKDLLWNAMLAATSGPDRIRGGLPPGTPVAHKTGTSGTDSTGVTTATNDVGYVQLPNGSWFAIAVFVVDSREDALANAAMIAGVARAAWKHFAARP